MHPTRGVFSSPSATSSFNALAVIGKKGEQPVVMTSKATSTSISLFKFDFNGVFSKMEVHDCESPCFRGLLGVEFTNAGQIAYGKKSESVYVAHQHDVIKINPCGEFFDIDAHEAHGLAVDEKEDVYFASYNGLDVLRASGASRSTVETVCGGKWNYHNHTDGVRHLFYDSQSGLLYFTEEKGCEQSH